jgi:hypothetical protein
MLLSDDDDVHFVIDQQAELDFYSTRSPKQQSTGRHDAPFRNIIQATIRLVFNLTLSLH